VYDAWKSPETLAIISKVAGVDLVPAMDFEIGHVNISVQSEEQKNKALAAVAEKKSREADEGVAGCPWEDENPIVDLHTDSYPFVCVTMLSDCTEMIGGETALRRGDGEVVKVRGPQMVCIENLIISKRMKTDNDNRVLLSFCKVVTLSTRPFVPSAQLNVSPWSRRSVPDHQPLRMTLCSQQSVRSLT
jgi:hypothetical protein